MAVMLVAGVLDDIPKLANPPKPPELGAAAAPLLEAVLKPPFPNLAAIRALASSRSLVCRATYCASVSPVNRSIPLRSSPGRPGASCADEDAPEKDVVLLLGVVAKLLVAKLLLAPPPPFILADPNPEYLLGVAAF